MTTELPLNPLCEVDRFLQLMMHVSLKFAGELKATVDAQTTVENLKADLLRCFSALELDEIYSGAGEQCQDLEALMPYLRVMFNGTMVDPTRLENFGQLEKAIACLMICSLTDQDFNRRFFQCWILAGKNPGLDLASQARNKLYRRLAAGDSRALGELNQLQERLLALENRQTMQPSGQGAAIYPQAKRRLMFWRMGLRFPRRLTSLWQSL
ncbi:hypothetical protein [Pseudomonas sp. S1(2024)]|uniref:hypothetical protein n=1 Tax=Pseudomonas sp. S1(2024) TaxID=3390191 RepID=UPI0039781969